MLCGLQPMNATIVQIIKGITLCWVQLYELFDQNREPITVNAPQGWMGRGVRKCGRYVHFRVARQLELDLRCKRPQWLLRRRGLAQFP